MTETQMENRRKMIDVVLEHFHLINRLSSEYNFLITQVGWVPPTDLEIYFSFKDIKLKFTCCFQYTDSEKIPIFLYISNGTQHTYSTSYPMDICKEFDYMISTFAKDITEHIKYYCETKYGRN